MYTCNNNNNDNKSIHTYECRMCSANDSGVRPLTSGGSRNWVITWDHNNNNNSN